MNDDNAWAMGGVAGHAGLFSTAANVARLGQEWLLAHGGARADPRRQGRPGVRAARRDAGERAGAGLGHAERGRVGRSGRPIGSVLGRGPLGAIGHLGYTGCSLWIDRDRQLVCALLTNHVFPGGRRPAEILAVRQAFHDAVAEAVG